MAPTCSKSPNAAFSQAVRFGGFHIVGGFSLGIGLEAHYAATMFTPPYPICGGRHESLTRKLRLVTLYRVDPL